MVFDDKYQFLLDKFGEETIANRHATWLGEIRDVVNYLGGDKFVINYSSFSLAVLDYFTDIARLKDFQGIERINVQKIYAYGTYWLLRRAPVQTVIDDITPELAHINEKVVTFILAPKLLAEIGSNLSSIKGCGKDKFLSFINLLYYNFRFRPLTPQALELAIDAFITGYRLSE